MKKETNTVKFNEIYSPLVKNKGLSMEDIYPNIKELDKLIENVSEVKQKPVYYSTWKNLFRFFFHDDDSAFIKILASILAFFLLLAGLFSNEDSTIYWLPFSIAIFLFVIKSIFICMFITNENKEFKKDYEEYSSEKNQRIKEQIAFIENKDQTERNRIMKEILKSKDPYINKITEEYIDKMDFKNFTNIYYLKELKKTLVNNMRDINLS